MTFEAVGGQGQVQISPPGKPTPVQRDQDPLPYCGADRRPKRNSPGGPGGASVGTNGRHIHEENRGLSRSHQPVDMDLGACFKSACTIGSRLMRAGTPFLIKARPGDDEWCRAVPCRRQSQGHHEALPLHGPNHREIAVTLAQPRQKVPRSPLAALPAFWKSSRLHL